MRSYRGKQFLDILPIAILVLVIGLSALGVIKGVFSQKSPEMLAHAEQQQTVEMDLSQINLDTDPVYERWYSGAAGYQKAVAEQMKTKKPMVVYFYAPWCPHCKRFHLALLARPEVIKAMDAYIKVRVYPDEDKADHALMEKLGASGFPTFYIKRAEDTAFKEVNIHGPMGGAYLTSKYFIARLEKMGGLSKQDASK